MTLERIRHAWISTDGSTGARNYDEFQRPAEVVEAIRARPNSMLSVDLPQHEPAFADAEGDQAALLARAAGRLAEMKRRGLLREWHDVLVAYEIEGGEGRQLGVALMLPTADIWDAETNPSGRIIRNEDVFPEKVVSRTAHVRALRHFVSFVLLVAEDAAEYCALIEEAIGSAPPLTTDVDQRGNEHRLWVVEPGQLQRRLLAWLGARELVVADGNHRSLAAQMAGYDRFLGVVMAAETMRILPYDRVLASLDMEPDAFLGRLREAGFQVTPSETFEVPAAPHQVGLYLPGRAFALEPPAALANADDPVERLDHRILESLVFRSILGLDPADPRIDYVGGDYGPDHLREHVDAGEAAAAFALPPVQIAEFMEVNRRRLRMPPKSTWFRPKVRSGLVVAQVD